MRHTKTMSSNNTPKNSNLNKTKVYNISCKSVLCFFPCEIKTFFKIPLKIQFFTRAVHETHGTKKQVQKLSRSVGFHSSALKLLTQFGHQDSSFCPAHTRKGKWISTASKTEMTAWTGVPWRWEVIRKISNQLKYTFIWVLSQKLLQCH